MEQGSLHVDQWSLTHDPQEAKDEEATFQISPLLYPLLGGGTELSHFHFS